MIGKKVEYKKNNNPACKKISTGIIIDKIRCAIDLGWHELREGTVDCYLIETDKGSIVTIPCTHISKVYAAKLLLNEVSQREVLLLFAGWLYGNHDKEAEEKIVDDYLNKDKTLKRSV